ncbi:hypothetical protein ACWC3X_45230, partial [Streptomyces populi]
AEDAVDAGRVIDGDGPHAGGAGHRGVGAGDQEMRQIIAEGFKEIYFQDSGARAMGLSDVEINDIDYLDLDY